MFINVFWKCWFVWKTTEYVYHRITGLWNTHSVLLFSSPFGWLNQVRTYQSFGSPFLYLGILFVCLNQNTLSRKSYIPSNIPKISYPRYPAENAEHRDSTISYVHTASYLLETISIGQAELVMHEGYDMIISFVPMCVAENAEISSGTGLLVS